MGSRLPSTFATFHRSVIGESYRNPAEERGLKCNVFVLLFINREGTTTSTDTGTLCRSADSAVGTLYCQIDNHFHVHDNSPGLIGILTTVLVEDMKFHTYS